MALTLWQGKEKYSDEEQLAKLKIITYALISVQYGFKATM